MLLDRPFLTAEWIISDRMGDFNASSIAYEVQKCVSNKFFSNKFVVLNLLEERTARLLDDLFSFVEVLTTNKQTSEKTTKNLIKLSVKVVLLLQGDRFSHEERRQLELSQTNFHTVVKTLISYHQVDHTYDRSLLLKYLSELETMLKNLVRPHLTEKSVSRVEQIFSVVKSEGLLDKIYQPNVLSALHPEMSCLMGRVVHVHVQDLTACI